MTAANRPDNPNGLRIGAHVSAAGSLADAPIRAKEIGCECFQFFSRSPRGGPAPELDSETTTLFRQRCSEYSLPAVIHAPYYINFASHKLTVRRASSRVIREELDRGSQLGCFALMTHLGSAGEQTRKQAIDLTIDGICALFNGYRGQTQFLIELSAGAGAIIGDSFAEVRAIIHGVEKRLPVHVGVCFDTCHVFASGYDLRTPAAVRQTLDEFDRAIGLDRLAVIHLNDAKFELGSRKDRHEHIGLGRIGRSGFQAIMAEPRLGHLLGVLETPLDGRMAKDITILKKLRFSA